MCTLRMVGIEIWRITFPEMKPEHFKKWREEIGYSQGHLSRLLRVHRRTISAWEHGRQSIPPYMHLALAELRRQWYVINHFGRQLHH